MVVTIEPGVYIAEEELGVRIENDWLITEEGAVCLSSELPSAPDELLAFLNKARGGRRRGTPENSQRRVWILKLARVPDPGMADDRLGSKPTDNPKQR